MSRLPRGSRGSGSSSGSGSDNHGIGGSSSYESPSFSSSGYTEDGVAAEAADAIKQRVINSFVYRQVFQVFSQDPDPYWITQLKGIIDSIVGASHSWADDLGLSTGSSDKDEAMYNEAINNIMTLYNQYRTYKNTLPVNQVQQWSDAGINSAITGQGITSSSIGELGLQSNAAGMQSTNPGAYLSDVANFALNASTGLTGILSSYADVALKFKDLDLRERVQDFNEDKTFADFKNILSNSGVILTANSWSELNDKDPDWHDNANSRAKALYNSYKEYTDSKNYLPTLIHGVESGEYKDKYLTSTGYQDGENIYHDGYGMMRPYGYYGVSLSRNYAELGKMQVDLAMAKAMHSAEVGSSLIAEGLTPDDIQKAQASEAKANSNFNARKATIFLTRLEKLVDRSSKGDPIASVELINLMQSADWQESAAYLIGEMGTGVLQQVGSSLEDIASWSSDEFSKCIKFIKSKIK